MVSDASTSDDARATTRSRLVHVALQSLPLLLFLLVSLPILPRGPVIGSRQDEWYNVVRALRALYEWGNPAYFIHPALFYELLAGLFAGHCAVLQLAGVLGEGRSYLDFYLEHTDVLLNLARATSLLFGGLSILGAMQLARKLADERAGLVAGFVLAGSPLLADLATSIRVDTTSLFFFILAVVLILRYRRMPSTSNLVVAALAVGVATAANYPGALLLLLLGFLVPRQEGRPTIRQVGAAMAVASSISLLVFLALNPYVLLDFGRFWWWFTFQVGTTVHVHPHAAQPSLTYYLGVLAEQGLHVVIVAALAVVAAFRSRSALGTISGFSIGYFVVFSLLRSQYDRFILPALALAVICGTVYALRAVDSWILPGRRHLACTAVLAMTVLAMTPWFVRNRIHHPHQRHVAASGEVDHRRQMFDWLMENLPAHSTLIYESDTLPLLQIAYDPPEAEGRLQRELRSSFARHHPVTDRTFIKAQFIGGVVNYEPELLLGPRTYFLESSRNRRYIDENAETLTEPKAFYDTMTPCSAVVHEVEGRDETLAVQAIDSTCARTRGEGT